MNKDRRADLQSICDQMEQLRDKLDAIREDEETARANMEGTNLEYTDNYLSVEQAVGFLDAAMEGFHDEYSLSANRKGGAPA